MERHLPLSSPRLKVFYMRGDKEIELARDDIQSITQGRPKLVILLGLGIAGGLLPDPGALAILLAAIASGGVGSTNSVNRPSANRPILLARSSRNHTAELGSTMISPSPLFRVGTSSAVTWPSIEIRPSWSALCSVVHTVPLVSIATP
jgi:hypothetical protein